MSGNLLQEAVERHTESQIVFSPFTTPIKGLLLLRADHHNLTNHHICRPGLCIIVQGAKLTMFGEKRFDYQAGQALVVSVEMPALSTIVAASPSEPYLGVIIEFDLAIMREVMDSLETLPKEAGEASRSIFVTDFEGPLAECVLRMVRLLDTPKAISLFYPGVMREICYWLLTGPHGGEVISMTFSRNHTQNILNAIHFLRDHFREPAPIERLASIAQLSLTAFQRHFKEITSMTPLQYQKQLRLLEARRLMVADESNVKTTAFQVGYESASQFSREYARMFGLPPRQDIVNLQHATTS